MVNNKEANGHVLIRDQRMLMKIEMMYEVIVKEIVEIIVTDEAIVRMKKKRTLTNKNCKIKKKIIFFKKKKQIPTEIVIPFGEVIWDGEIDHKEVDI